MLHQPHQSDQAKQQNQSSYSDSDTQRREYQEQFKLEKKEKKYQQTSFILGCLKNHFIFYNLSEGELQNIAKNMFYCSVPAQQFIFKEGDRAQCFFIIEKGNMQAITKQKVKKQLRVGDGFGEVALLYKAPRSVSVKAVENCSLWGIDRQSFKKSVEAVIIKQYEENRKFMQSIRFFSCLTNQDKDSIIATLIVQKFAKDEIIVNQGDPGSSFYIIKEGSASVWKGNKQIKKLEKGEEFGQQALYYNTVRQVTVKAEEDIVCLVLGRQNLAKVLGDRIFVVTFRNFIKWCFDKHYSFSKLSKDQIQNIIDQMKINFYKSGNVVIKKTSQNGSNQKIIVVIQGALKKSKTSNPLVLKSHFYGEDFLSSFQQNKQKMIDDEIVIDSDGVLAEISAFNFKNIIGGPLDIVLAKNQRMLLEKMNAQQMNRAKYFQKIQQFSLIRQLRQGNFGPVLLVRHNNDKGIYVLKCYSKQKIQELFIQKYIIQEKNLLRDINSKFIIELYKTFRDSKNLYSLVQFIRGQELYDVIREIGLLSTDDCQFYVACIILILEEFYNSGIIHRDIKPENFIVNMKGYPILCNLSTAKLLPAKGKNFHQMKTNTIIGTPHYIAPEIIQGKGYNFTVDLYSVGICMYQFLCGYLPFGDSTQDPQKIYDQILNSDLKYPKFLKDKKAKKLIDQFLCKTDPQERLGGSGFHSIKCHPWFQSIDWQKLKQHEVKTPKFVRKPNIPETDKDLCRFADINKKKVEDFLNQHFGNRHSDELKSYDNW